MSPLLGLEHQQKDFLKSIPNSPIGFLSFSFGIETTNTYVHSDILDKNGQSLYPFSDQNGTMTIPFGAAHTCMA